MSVCVCVCVCVGVCVCVCACPACPASLNPWVPAPSGGKSVPRGLNRRVASACVGAPRVALHLYGLVGLLGEMGLTRWGFDAVSRGVGWGWWGGVCVWVCVCGGVGAYALGVRV